MEASVSVTVCTFPKGANSTLDKMSVSPIKLPQPEDTITWPDTDEEVKQKREEEGLRKKLLDLTFAGGFDYSRKIIRKANLEQLREIHEIYDHKVARHLVETLISYMAIFIATGLYKIDWIPKDRVEPLTNSLSEDELLKRDLVWLLGKFIPKVPCPGLSSAGVKIGLEVTSHKLSNRLREGASKVASIMKETEQKVLERGKKEPPKRQNSLSSISSDSEDESLPTFFFLLLPILGKRRTFFLGYSSYHVELSFPF